MKSASKITLISAALLLGLQACCTAGQHPSNQSHQDYYQTEYSPQENDGQQFQRGQGDYYESSQSTDEDQGNYYNSATQYPPKQRSSEVESRGYYSQSGQGQIPKYQASNSQDNSDNPQSDSNQSQGKSQRTYQSPSWSDSKGGWQR